MNEKCCFSLEPIYEKVSYYLLKNKASPTSKKKPTTKKQPVPFSQKKSCLKIKFYQTRDLLNFRIVSKDVYNLSSIPSNKAKLYNNVITYAIRCGDLPVIKWFLLKSPCKNDLYIINKSASKGYLEVLKWLHDSGFGKWTTSAMDKAAENGHLEVVEWLHNNRTEGCTTNAMDKAAENGHLEVVEWLHKNRTEGCSSDCAMKATRNGRLDVVKFLVKQRIEIQRHLDGAIELAIQYGHLEIIKFFYDKELDEKFNDE
ncbi:MAG: ankyrin repeat domain-containing protein, partial [Candidatus Paceibacterota bacterium]